MVTSFFEQYRTVYDAAIDRLRQQGIELEVRGVVDFYDGRGPRVFNSAEERDAIFAQAMKDENERSAIERAMLPNGEPVRCRYPEPCPQCGAHPWEYCRTVDGALRTAHVARQLVMGRIDVAPSATDVVELREQVAQLAARERQHLQRIDRLRREVNRLQQSRMDLKRHLKRLGERGAAKARTQIAFAKESGSGVVASPTNHDVGRTCQLCGGAVPSGTRYEHGIGVCKPPEGQR